MWLVIFLQNITRNAKNKYHCVYIVYFNTKICFAFLKIEKATSDLSVYCNLCRRVIEKTNERVFTLKGMETIWRTHRDWKFGNIFAIDRKQVRLQKLCSKTEKLWSIIEQTEKLEAELKSLCTSEDSLTLKRSAELLSDDRDAPTSKKECKSDKGFPRMLTSSPVRPLQRTSSVAVFTCSDWSPTSNT